MPSGFIKNYLLAEKSAGDGAAAMVELISVISKKMKSVGRERGWMGLMGDALVRLHVDVSFTDGSS